MTSGMKKKSSFLCFVFFSGRRVAEAEIQVLLALVRYIILSYQNNSGDWSKKVKAPVKQTGHFAEQRSTCMLVMHVSITTQIVGEFRVVI